MLDWNGLEEALRSEHPDRMMTALEAMQRDATLEDVPFLVQLLEFPDWLVRDTAIMTLSDLDVIDALPAIIRAFALDRGQQDYDGVTDFTAELMSRHPAEVPRLTTPLLDDPDPAVQEMAQWWLADWNESLKLRRIPFL